VKSLLVLTPRYPYPVVGGDRLRIYQLCKALSGRFRLTLLSLCDKRSEMTMPLPDDGVFASIERLYLPRWKSWMNCAAALPREVPLQIAYYRHAGFRARAAELMSTHDAAIAHLVRVGDAIKDLPGIKFLEMTDAISLNYERIRETRHARDDLRSRIFALEARRLRRYEESIVDHFDHSFLVSEIDRRFLFGNRPDRLSRVSVCSNGVDLQGLPFAFDPAGQDLVFIGNMHSLQNLDAANFAATDVLPRVRARRPGATLRLIGRIHPDQAARLAAIEGVHVTGEVPDVARAARGGGIGLCPLRLGAGVQNKVLEYMALGLPTVSTTLGLEGFEARGGHELVVADDADAIAQAALRLLADRATAHAMAVAARAYVDAHHSWEGRLAPLVARVDEAVARGDRLVA
jgi:glycosyltransferase involved in cell wall biosynthesis